MIKGYKTQIMDYYEKIRYHERKALQERKDNIKREHPEILDLENEIGRLSIKLSMDILRHGNADDVVSKTREAITDLRVQKAELLVAYGYGQDYLSMHYQCSKCNDTGYIGTKRCSCFDRYLVKLYYKSSELAESIKTNNFNTFNLDFYSPRSDGSEKFSPRDNIKQILSYIKNDYIPNFKNHSVNMLFYGDPGTGKTFMTQCIAKELLDKGFLVIYKTSDELNKDLRTITFDNDKALEESLINCDLLIIDDLGAEQITDFSVTNFFTFLNKKLIKNKKMLISTNLLLSDLTKSYTERITSRLFGNFRLQKFYTEDIRIQKKSLRQNRFSEKTILNQ